MKPLYVVGTQRDIGKTTFCIGLISALQRRGLKVGYAKPLGQRVHVDGGHAVHEDALVVSQVMDMGGMGPMEMAVPLTRGRVEKEIYDLHVPELSQKVVTMCERLRQDHDVVVIEGMGHVATGAVLKLSAADSARVIGARALLISGGGIGKAIDDISLCTNFLTSQGAQCIGVVVNKVWPEKYERIKEATTKGLENLGIRCYGMIPYEGTLESPTVRQVAQYLNCRILCGTGALSNRVGKTIVGAMETSHMVSYLTDRALVITPGDRNDNILAIVSTYTLMTGSPPPVAGLILTGGFVPLGSVMELLVNSGIPTLQCSDDTYAVAARLGETVFKITPEDTERIEVAVDLVSKHVDISAILEALGD
ncbi:MAG: AAA family ATPase [Phycisphaerae bacterium]|nr:AAA family ATPase [Phycisphaerae bacterium]